MDNTKEREREEWKEAIEKGFEKESRFYWIQASEKQGKIDKVDAGYILRELKVNY